MSRRAVMPYVCFLGLLGGFFLALPRDAVAQDRFETDLGEWTFYSDTEPGEPLGYSAYWDGEDGRPAGSAHVSGDWSPQDAIGDAATRRFGIQRLFVGLSRFHLTFDWRAYSSNSPTTRASIELVDAADETVIHRQVLIAGSTLDSGWLTFPPTDFSDLMPSSGTDVIVRIFLSDAWAADHEQNLLVDNVLLVTEGLDDPDGVETVGDDFSNGTAPWALWQEDPSLTDHSYTLTQDVDAGVPPPSAGVLGSYEYSGSTLRFGLERRIPVTLPFVLSTNLVAPDSAYATLQLLELDGTLRHTWTLYTGTPDWTTYAPPDLTPTVLGLDEVLLRAWVIGTDYETPDNGLWLDEVAWTMPCDTPSMWYRDLDGDGFGDVATTHPYGVMCHPLPGWVSDATDCDDDEPASFPGNPEICDGLDNDCDPASQEVVDNDGDGSPSCPDEDCDDNDPSRAPGFPEECNGVDDDCDDRTDLDGTDTDSDGDGYLACAGDCDDEDPNVSPDSGTNPDCDDEDDDDHEARGCGCSTARSVSPSALVLLLGIPLLRLRRRPSLRTPVARDGATARVGSTRARGLSGLRPDA